MMTRRDVIRWSGSASVLGLCAAHPAFAQATKLAETLGIADALFANPYVDKDEWRDFPVRHRYVHGGFKGTDTRFSFYFAPKEQFGGRFFQTLSPAPGSENGAQRLVPRDNPAVTQDVNTIRFAIASGAYLVESNMGALNQFATSDPTISGYRASAAVAQYSRVLAAQMYGPHRTYGYVFGPSGGSLRTVACIENTTGVWDGAVPYVMACNMAMPYSFTIRAYALRVLKDKFTSIVDAVDPGGSGDMYAGLNDEERAALREATLMGFPPGAWFGHKQMAFGATAIFGSLLDNFLRYDPSYFEDFWKVPGYLGANPPPSLVAAKVDHATKISRLLTAEEAERNNIPIPNISLQTGKIPAGLYLESVPQKDLAGTSVYITSGAASGCRVLVTEARDNLVLFSFGPDNIGAVSKIAADDAVRLDNAVYLATQTYHRHQVASPDFYAWNQYRGADGKPIYPQRPRLLGPLFQNYATGTQQTGRFNGKMIVVGSILDEGAFPWYSDLYRSMVKRALGNRLDDHYRLWFNENANHGGVEKGADKTRIISYVGSVQQALRDVSAWVEKGVVPPPSTVYHVVDSQIVVAKGSGARKGIQPGVRLKANGGARAEVRVGEPVALGGEVDVAHGAGTLVAASWDFDGKGDFPLEGKIEAGNPSHPATISTRHAFDKPGTYFVTLRVRLQRHPDGSDFALVENLARARVIVTDA